MVWLPVAAAEHPERRINVGDREITEDELREAARSFDPDYRPVSFISGLNIETGATGPSHFFGQFNPELASVRAMRFNEETAELEAEPDRTDGILRAFEKGYRTPSIHLMRLPDHPSGEPRQYCQHITLVGPGELEIIAGLGGARWADRLRSMQADLEAGGRFGRFRTLTTEELPMTDKEKAKPDGVVEDKAKPDEAKPDGDEAKGRERSASGEEPEKKERAKTPLREAKKDPAAERDAQQDDRIRSLSETVRGLTETVNSFVEAAGDPDKIRANAKASEEALDRIRARDEKDRVDSLQSRVRALAEGDQPRLRTADAENYAEMLALLPADKAEEQFEKLRAQKPIAQNLGEEFITGGEFDNLPPGFDVERFRAADGSLPSPAEIAQLAELSKEGKGDPVEAAIARERAANTRRAYQWPM